MSDEGFGYWTVEAIMRLYGVRRSYVYKLASKKKWRRYKHPDGTTRYWAENVHDTLRPEGNGRKRHGLG